MTPVSKYTNPPPEPVDVNNQQWVVRAWQWIFDTLRHMDECMDDVKKSNADLRAEVVTWLAVRDGADDALDERIERHQQFHEQMNSANKAKRDQLSAAWAFLKEGARAIYDIGKFVIAIGALRLVGIL